MSWWLFDPLYSSECRKWKFSKILTRKTEEGIFAEMGSPSLTGKPDLVSLGFWMGVALASRHKWIKFSASLKSYGSLLARNLRQVWTSWSSGNIRTPMVSFFNLQVAGNAWAVPSWRKIIGTRQSYSFRRRNNCIIRVYFGYWWKKLL